MRRSVVKLRDLDSVAEINPCEHGRAHATPISCRNKTELLLTLRRWLTDLMELQAAGSSPSKETVMQSLNSVTGGIRDPNNVHEITDLLAPNDPGKLYSAIQRKAAGWAVLDADVRHSDTARLERDRVPKVITEVRTARRFPHAKGTCARGDKCRFSHDRGCRRRSAFGRVLLTNIS